MKVGERVIVSSMSNDQTYVILGRMHIYR
ncbi:hypothetical protein [Paenibacillus alkalitolerans]